MTSNQMLDTLLSYMENTKDFVLEQAPDVIKQALKYETISSYIDAIFMFILLTAALCIAYYIWKNPNIDKYGSWATSSVVPFAASLILSPFFVLALCCAIDKIVKIHVAPKYFLINLIMNMKK